MKLGNSHAVKPGRSIIEQLRDKTDEYFAKWMDPESAGDAGDIWQGRIEGLCDAMALMTNTKADLQFDSAEARYEDRKRRGEKNAV